MEAEQRTTVRAGRRERYRGLSRGTSPYAAQLLQRRKEDSAGETGPRGSSHFLEVSEGRRSYTPGSVAARRHSVPRR
jgi:hypothetical protein